MKNKVIKSGVIVVSTITLSVVLAYLFTTFFNISISKIYSLNIFKQLVEEKILLSVFISSAFFIAVLIFSQIGIRNHGSYKSGMIKITDKISIPVPAGQFQHGSSIFVDDKEKALIFKTEVLNLNDRNILKLIQDGKKDIEMIERGEDDENCIDIIGDNFSNICVPVDFKKSFSEEKISVISGDLHTCCVGSTRSGKSRTLVIQSICLQALSGVSMLTSDPKGELYLYTYPFLKKVGYQVIVIDFKNPKKSDSYNFLYFVIKYIDEDIAKAVSYAWDLADSLVTDNKTDPIWSNGEKSVIVTAILIVVYDNSKTGLSQKYYDLTKEEIMKIYQEQKIYQNMTNVYNVISCLTKRSFKNEKQPLVNDLINSLPKNHPARLTISLIESSPDETRGSFIASALSTLRLFTDPNISALSSDTNEYLFDNDKKKAIFIILPDEKKTYYPLASLIVNQYYQYLVNISDDRGGRLVKDFKFNLDEFGNFSKIPDFDVKLTVGAGRGIHFNIYLQSFSQLNTIYSKEVASTIVANCHYWIYLKTSDQTTLELISKKLGTYSIMSTSDSNSTNTSSKDGGSVSSSKNLISRPLLTPSEISKIERPYMLIIGQGKNFITSSPDLSSWTFNTILGLGDEDFNTKVKNYRNEIRNIHTIEDIKLWDYLIHLIQLDGIKDKKIYEEEQAKLDELDEIDFDKIFN